MQKIIPPVFGRPDHSLSRVMTLLGEKFVIVPETKKPWFREFVPAGTDCSIFEVMNFPDWKVRGPDEPIPAKVWVCQKENSNSETWEVSEWGAEHPIEKPSRRDQYSLLKGESLLEAVAQDEVTVLRILSLFAGEKEQAEKTFHSLVCNFWHQVMSSNFFSCLSKERQECIQDRMRFIEGGLEVEDYLNEEKEMSSISEEVEEAMSLHLRQQAGEILVNFGGHFRRMGTSNNSDFWVIAGDGRFFVPSKTRYRPRYKEEGEKIWRVVEEGDLAISWKKPSAGAEHQCLVGKFPADGVTPQQQETVRDLTRSLTAQWAGVKGISGKVSPSIEFGWGLSLGQKTHSLKSEEMVSSPQETTQPEKVVKKEEEGLQHSLFAQLAKLSK